MKYLVVGLGNPGAEYENTRHNIGFKIIDRFASLSAKPDSGGDLFMPHKYADVAYGKDKGRTYVLVKPTTFMNLSGKAVNYWLQKERIPLDRIIIVTDDITLPFGTVRIRAKGGDGGHNGLKDIISNMGRTDFARLRFGVGSDFGRGQQVDYVLAQWDAEEQNQLSERIDRCVDALKSFGSKGLQPTMNEFNNS